MFTHILLFLRFLIRIYFLSVLAKRETTQLILEHPAEFPVHGHLGSGLTSLRTVLDRIFFFLKRFFYSFRPQCQLCTEVSVWLHVPGRIHPWGSSCKIQPQIYIQCCISKQRKKSILPQVFGMNKGKTIKSMFNTSREGENKTSINAGKEELTGDRKYGKTV